MLTVRETCNMAHKQIDLLRHVGSGQYVWWTETGMVYRRRDIGSRYHSDGERVERDADKIRNNCYCAIVA